MTREDIAETLDRIAQLLELQGENPFKIRAYREGAETVRQFPGDIVARAREENGLDGIKGIGPALREKLHTLATTGALPFYENLRASFPETIFELFDVPGLGPKKVKLLHDTLGVGSLNDLKSALAAGTVAALPGFGEKSAAKLNDSLARAEATSGMARRDTATAHAEAILEFLRGLPEVSQCSPAGSFRRGKEVVGDLDFLAASLDPSATCHAFASAPFVESILAAGDTKVSILLPGGLQCDLRAIRNSEFPFALQYFTGSKEHNVAIRARARKLGYSLNEYALTPIDGADAAPAPEIPDEDSLYRCLGLDPIPPALRENTGEIEAAETGQLPRLIQWSHLRGTFHNHTTASDGEATLEEMAAAAIDLGLTYLGIADHSQSSFQAHGLTADRLEKQLDEIARLNQRFQSEGIDFQLLSGSEVDIHKDGTLDFPDELLARLDYVVASVHSSFTLPAAEQTARILRAMENPHVDILGHLTGRLLLRRDSYALDIPAILEAAAATHTVIELNASPWRLDMDWRWWRRARDLGVLCAINPDAHSTTGLTHLRFGAEAAAKGWLRPEDILNTRPLKEIKKFLVTPKSEREWNNGMGL